MTILLALTLSLPLTARAETSAAPARSIQAPAPPAQAATPATAAALRARFQARLDAVADGVDGVVGYCLIDLTSGDRFTRLEHGVFPTASTIKLAVLYEIERQVQEGRLSLDAVKPLDPKAAVAGSGILHELGTPALSLRDYTVLMIVLSDNTATNVLIDTVGMQAVTARMLALGLRETKLRRKMIDLAAAKRGDENVSTPAEIARLLEILHRGEGLQPACRDEALAILKKEKVSPLVQGVPAGVEVASKPGELEGVRVDAGIVYAKNRPYIFSVMSTYLLDDDAGSRALEEMSRAAYQYFSRLGAATGYGRQIGR
jgi:beta-lactamase class A